MEYRCIESFNLKAIDTKGNVVNNKSFYVKFNSIWFKVKERAINNINFITLKDSKDRRMTIGENVLLEMFEEINTK